MTIREKIDSIDNYQQQLRLIERPLLEFTFSRVFDKSSAEDIVHDVLLILCAKANQFDSNKSFHGWAFKICNFQIKKYLTKQKRNREDPHEFIWDLTRDSCEPDPAELIREKEDKSELNKIIDFLLNNLPPQQKQVMECIMNGMSRKDARVFMNLKERHFNLAYYRTVKSCKKILENERKKESILIK